MKQVINQLLKIIMILDIWLGLVSNKNCSTCYLT